METVHATAEEIGDLFTVLGDDIPNEGHPEVVLLGKLQLGGLDKTMTRNVGEHAHGCPHCCATITLLMALATKTAGDRAAIARDLGLTVSLVDAFRSTRRSVN